VIITVYNIYFQEDVIERNRKRSRVTFMNIKNVREIFNNCTRRILFISLAINIYNHYMNGADIANQLRKFLIT
jgi:hypothetical protein